MHKILRQNLFVDIMSVIRCLFIHQNISDKLKHNVGVRPSIQIWMKLSYSAKVASTFCQISCLGSKS